MRDGVRFGFLCGSLLLGVLLAWGSKAMRETEWRRVQELQAQRDQIVHRYLRAGADRRRFWDHYPMFQRMTRASADMITHRLNWMERLRILSDRLGLFDLRYEIDEGKPMKSGEAEDLLFVSDMRVQLGLLHEADLLWLLRGLRAYPQAHLRVSECHLRRVNPAVNMQVVQANILADCELRWLGVRRMEP